MHKNILMFVLGIIVGAAIILSVSLFTSNERDRTYKEQQQRLIDINKQLGESIRNREKTIEGLKYISGQLQEENSRIGDINSQLEASAERRRTTLIEARRIIESTDDSLERLELIIQSFAKLE